LWTVSTELSGRERWNAKHRDVCVGGTETREWLARHRNLLAEKVPGRALDVACGAGREAVYLAELGLAVDAVDVSDVATERVRERAGEGAPEIEARRMDLSDPETAFPHPSYDVICCFYFLKRPLLAAWPPRWIPAGCSSTRPSTATTRTSWAGRSPRPSSSTTTSSCAPSPICACCATGRRSSASGTAGAPSRAWWLNAEREMYASPHAR
jgi:hypothetical protein